MNCLLKQCYNSMSFPSPKNKGDGKRINYYTLHFLALVFKNTTENINILPEPFWICRWNRKIVIFLIFA